MTVLYNIGVVYIIIRYKCNNCNALFTKELMKNGIFVCPTCRTYEFEKIELKNI
jgi:DNA-directed RNA polymerase subunit RPC12/RpoP